MSPNLRAGLILLFILVNGASGCPLVPNIQPRHVQSEVGARELGRWGTRLRGLGVEITDEELATKTLALSAQSRAIHGRVLRPFSFYFSGLQIDQSWGLFSIADPDPWWMFLETRGDDGSWQVRYQPLGVCDIGEVCDILEYRRIRAHWNPGTNGPRADYVRFVDWISYVLFEREPEINEVRVRFQRFHVEAPGETRSSDISWHFEEIRQRP